MGGRMFAVLSIAGPLWSNGLRVPIAPERDQVRVWSEAACRRFGDNLACSVARIEPMLVAAIEPHRPRGRAWFSRVTF
jgi:hypothetical protein